MGTPQEIIDEEREYNLSINKKPESFLLELIYVIIIITIGVLNIF